MKNSRKHTLVSMKSSTELRQKKTNYLKNEIHRKVITGLRNSSYSRVKTKLIALKKLLNLKKLKSNKFSSITLI